MRKPQTHEQNTLKGEKIPVPSRGEFDANLDKLIKAPQPPKKVRARRSQTTRRGA